MLTSGFTIVKTDMRTDNALLLLVRSMTKDTKMYLSLTPHIQCRLLREFTPPELWAQLDHVVRRGAVQVGHIPSSLSFWTHLSRGSQGNCDDPNSNGDWRGIIFLMTGRRTILRGP